MSVSSNKIIEIIKQKIMCEICHSRVDTRSRIGFRKKRVMVCGRCYEMVKIDYINRTFKNEKYSRRN